MGDGSPSVLYLHNGSAEAEPDLINEFITETRGSRASNRGGGGELPMELVPVLLLYRPKERREGDEEIQE